MIASPSSVSANVGSTNDGATTGGTNVNMPAIRTPGSPTAAPTFGSTSSTLSNWIGPYVTNMLGQAQALANMPYATYQGPLTAGPSQIQSNIFQGLGSLTMPQNLGASFTSSGAPTIASASTAGPTTAPTATGIASQYMNPYLQAVLQPQLSEMQRQAQITQMNNAAKATQAGAFGGGRHGIMDAELQRNLLGEMNEAIGKGYASAYDSARDQFNTENRQNQGLVQLMSSIGREQRGIEQEGVTADYNEFLQQRDYPMRMVQFMQSMLQGLPIGTNTTSPGPQSGLVSAGQTIGGLSSLMEALKGLGIGR